MKYNLLFEGKGRRDQISPGLITYAIEFPHPHPLLFKNKFYQGSRNLELLQSFIKAWERQKKQTNSL